MHAFYNNLELKFTTSEMSPFELDAKILAVKASSWKGDDGRGRLQVKDTCVLKTKKQIENKSKNEN